MSWWGKMLGGTFGFMLGGPIGAILGTVVGHKLDKGMNQALDSVERVQTVFFTTTFSVMGHIAKADGHVSKDEIAMAKQIMTQMRLSAEQEKISIDLFNQGKQADFPLDEILLQFKKEAKNRHNLLRMFLEIQIHAAYADGTLHSKEHALLQHIATQIGFTSHEYQQIEQGVRAAHLFETGAESLSPQQQMEAAYALLEVNPEVSDTELKKAYRRMMSRHHPDKLVAKGLPEEMLKMATEKTQEIKAAYERLKNARQS